MASSSTSQKDYDVFLSFRGTDTRHNIVSHLHKALVDNGIRTFIDDRDLEDGNIISDQLVKAIQTSLFAVVVLSENYATSSWCLEELRLIMELRNEEKIRLLQSRAFWRETSKRNLRGCVSATQWSKEDSRMERSSHPSWQSVRQAFQDMVIFYFVTPALDFKSWLPKVFFFWAETDLKELTCFAC